MDYFLAIDAGGTKTDCVLASQEQILARVTVGSVKRMRVEASVAEANLALAMTELSRNAGLDLRSVTSACVGAAGSSVPLVADWLRLNMARYVGGQLHIVDDVEIALDAAFSGKRGVLLLAGTGSNAAARTATGTIVTAGGWGPAFGDQGSGFAIGRLALRTLFRAIDEERHSDLLDAVMEFWQVSSVSELVAKANSNPAPDFAELTPLIATLAGRGDMVAIETLNMAAQDLVDLANSVVNRLRKQEGSSSEAGFRLALAGSVLRKVEPVRAQTVARLQRLHPEIQVISQTPDPVMGALWRAKQYSSSSTDGLSTND